MPYCEEHYHHPSSTNNNKLPSPSPQKQQQNEEHNRKPPPLKPKPSIGSKPNLSPSPSTSNNRLAEESSSFKRPSISNRSSMPNSAATTTNPKPAMTETTRPSAKVCHHCNQMIDGPSASALGHDYHIHHFQCTDCNRALSSRVPGKSFYSHNYGRKRKRTALILHFI